MSSVQNFADITWDENVHGKVYDTEDPEVVRSLVLDTETTGLNSKGDDRIVEIGIVELINRQETGRIFHCYIDPKRDVPEEAFAVHGLSRDELVKLSGGRGFDKFANRLQAFIGNSTLIAHNSGFDMGFLNAEMARFNLKTFKENGNKVIDSLLTANLMFPGAANNLNALCRRFSIDLTGREYHGALLDASLLSNVYRLMTVSQKTLDYDGSKKTLLTTVLKPERLQIEPGQLKKAHVTEQDLERHVKLCERITKSSGGKCLASSLSFEM
jgi:DNA polymerase-3 subunit epsilon